MTRAPPPPPQAAFVAATNEDARLLNTSSTVAWEFVGSWRRALASYFPRYAAAGGAARGFIATQVPYDLPVAPLSRATYGYEVVDESVVVFAPREWRGTGTGSEPFSRDNNLNVTQMAKYLGALPRGTATPIYMTSDGGASLADFDALVEVLDEHVTIVNQNQLNALALAGEAQRAAATATVA